MSGIAGIICLDGAAAPPGLIEKMTGAMDYRGPDGIGHWVRGSVALGQCMLRTTPESFEEQQPLTNEDESLVLVMDGRVDNWEELRGELLAQGALLRNRSDAELVLRSYERWGRDCVAHIDGDFALVIWDARRREAFCARDRIGNKPFHYHWDGKRFVFASEPHPILALPWVREELNEGMVAEFLANEWYSRDETFWQGVLRLVAAHRMIVDACGPRSELYWEPDLWATLPCASDEEFVEHYRARVTDLVRRMSRCSQPLACEVSGGLDSSAIFALAEHLRRQQRLLAPALEGYTLAFTDDSEANELEYARAVGAYLGIKINEIAPSRMPLSWYRQRAARFRTFPSYPNGVMGLAIRSEAAGRGGRVLLVGVGGDEWLCGSRHYYVDAPAARQWHALAACLSADLREAGLGKSLWWAFRYGFIPLLPHGTRQRLHAIRARLQRRDSVWHAWLTPGLRGLLQERRERYQLAGAQKTRRVGQRGLMAMLSGAFPQHARDLEEGLSASVGIELRRPLFSAPMVEFAFSTPEGIRLRGQTDKYLHRKAMTGLLPEAVLQRQTKADFMITFEWHLAAMGELFRGELARAGRTWVDAGQVGSLYRRIGDPTHPGAPEWRLWTLFGCAALVSGR
jgi:asparagine synthase (glutamine-hydrolysing)